MLLAFYFWWAPPTKFRMLQYTTLVGLQQLGVFSKNRDLSKNRDFSTILWYRVPQHPEIWVPYQNFQIVVSPRTIFLKFYMWIRNTHRNNIFEIGRGDFRKNKNFGQKSFAAPRLRNVRSCFRDLFWGKKIDFFFRFFKIIFVIL